MLFRSLAIGKAPAQTVDFEEFEEKTAAKTKVVATDDMGEDFYGSDEYNDDEFDVEGFDEMTFDDKY